MKTYASKPPCWPQNAVAEAILRKLGYVNGVKVGASPEGVDSQWNVERRYPVPAGALKPGRNVIAVRIWDQFGGGGFNGPKLEMRLSPLPREVKHPLYHRDYRSDYPLGDDPYRYYRR